MNIEDALDTKKTICSQNDTYEIGKIYQMVSNNIVNLAAAPMGRWLVAFQDLQVESLTYHSSNEQKIWLFDSQNNVAKVIFHLKDDVKKGNYYSINNIYWFKNSKSVLIRFITHKETGQDGFIPKIPHFILNKVDKTNVMQINLPNNKLLTIHYLDNVEYLMFSDLDNKQPKISFLDSNGKFSPIIKLDYGMADFEIINIRYLGVNKDLSQVIFYMKIRNRKNEKLISEKWLSVRIDGKQNVWSNEKPADDYLYEKEKRKKDPMSLTTSDSILTTRQGFTVKTKSIWLVSEYPRSDMKFSYALVTAQSNGRISDVVSNLSGDTLEEWPTPILLSDMSAIFFTFDESLYVAPIIKMKRKII